MNSNAEKPLIGMALFAFIDAVIVYFANRYALPLFIYIGRSLYHKYIYLSQKNVRLSIARDHTKMMLNSNGPAMTLPYRSFPATLK